MKKENKKKTPGSKKKGTRILPALVLVVSGAAIWWAPAQFRVHMLGFAERRLDACVAEALVDGGIGDDNIESTFHRERNDGTIHWIETTRNMDVPRKVKLVELRNRIISAVKKAGGRVLRDEIKGRTWQFEAGRGEFVLQKMTFHL